MPIVTINVTPHGSATGKFFYTGLETKPVDKQGNPVRRYIFPGEAAYFKKGDEEAFMRNAVCRVVDINYIEVNGLKLINREIRERGKTDTTAVA